MILHKQKGVSLVELMVAITIGLILMAGVLSIFLSSKITYFSNEKMARIQENGRVALNLISHDVRASGYSGCARAVPFTSSLNTPTSLLWNYAIPLQGSENVAGTLTPALGITLTPAPIANSDVIVARTMRRDSMAMRVETSMATLTSDPAVLTSMAVPAAPGQVMMITDCNATAVFQVTGWTNAGATSTIQHAAVGASGGNPGNSTANIDYLFTAGSRVASLQTVIYYVGTDPATNEPALYRQTGAPAVGNQAQLLVEGVEALQVSYGRDTTGDRLADDYVSADAITNWDNILSVNYALLIRSEQAGTDTLTKTYNLLNAAAPINGKSLTFTDRRSRLVFTTTIALRNRAL
jgi:type IV pilus assembly protein PilW